MKPISFPLLGSIFAGFFVIVMAAAALAQSNAELPDPTITLVKVVVDDYSSQPALPTEFELTVQGNIVISNDAYPVAAGISYTIDEVSRDDYAFTSIGAGPNDSANCPSSLGESVVLVQGENMVCTIVNTAVPPTIMISAAVENDNGGTLLIEDTLIEVIGLNVSSPTFAGDETGVLITLGEGDYEIVGRAVEGYDVSYSVIESCSGSISTGESRTCVVVFDDQPVDESRTAEIKGRVFNDTDSDGIHDTGEGSLTSFTVFLDANQSGTRDLGEVELLTTLDGYSFDRLMIGSYGVCVAPQTGTIFTYPSGSRCQSVEITMNGQIASGVDFGARLERLGTTGMWRNWNKNTKHSNEQITGWMTSIDASSLWLMGGYRADTSGLTKLIDDATKRCAKESDIECAKRKFLAEYLATQLDVKSGRKSLSALYSTTAGADSLLSTTQEFISLGTLIQKTEALPATIDRAAYLTLAGLYSSINSTGI